MHCGSPSSPLPVYDIPLILASSSPRRIALMRQAGFRFTIAVAEAVEESYPPELHGKDIPIYLAKLKSDAFISRHNIAAGTVVITADTIVYRHNRVLGKPANRQEAILMLTALSGNMHQVYTGVCLTSDTKRQQFCAESKVYFRKLTAAEIVHYVDHYQPFDKAGAYGIQEWIGYVGIERIEGSYFNVVGLPVQQLYCELQQFIIPDSMIQ
jgi:septum formation protein